MADRQRLIDIFMDELPEEHPWKGNIKGLVDKLIANGVTFATDNNVGGKWISVKERLPENEKCVLVYSQDGGVAEGKYNARFKEWVQFRWNVTELKNVTHWMPLPKPPKGE